MTYPSYTAPTVGGSDVWGQTLNDYIKSVTTGQPGSADRPPTSANAKDDEFDGTSSVTWTATPTAANTWDINTTRSHHLYIKASGSGAAVVGRYQSVPGTPFTITAKLTSSTGRIDFHKAGGIFLAPSSPTGSSSALLLSHVARTSSSAGVQRTILTLAGSFSSESSAKGLAVPSGPITGARYLRLVVNSSTSVDSYCSIDGYAWLAVETAFNPGFTPAVMGLACNEESGGGGVEAYFDYFRVT